MIRTTQVARAFLTAVALGLLVPVVGVAQDIPSSRNVVMPTPVPMPTNSGTPLPYPAYGTPAPDVAHLTPHKGVPTTVTLAQAVRIAVALSPIFAADNAMWAAIHAKYTSEQQALFPAVSGQGTFGKSYSNTGIALNNGIVGPTPIPTPTPPNGGGRGTSGLGAGGTTASENIGITISQLIYDGGRTIAAIRSAKEGDYAGRATLIRNLETLEYNVSTAYYAVLQDNATVVADAQLVREFEINELSVAAQIQNGAAARSDIAAAQFQTAQARGNLVTAQGTAIAAQSTFNTTIGLDADAQAVPASLSTQPEYPNPTYAGSLARALIMRPDYIAAQHTVESDKENLRYAKLARFPILSAQATDTTGRDYGPSYRDYVNDKTLGLSLTVPIYDQGQTNYNVAVAAATLDQAVDSLQQTKLQVESDVRSALANLISARSLLVQTRSELVAGKVSLDATQAQYKVGATTIINVVTAEANLATAQAAYISSLYGVQTAEQNYLYALGTSDIQL